MTRRPAIRKLLLTVHLACSVGWIGAVVTYLGLGIAAATSRNDETVRAAWISMELTGWRVIVPLAFASLCTGVLISVATKWGLFRHYWVVFSLVLTSLAAVVLVLHMPAVSSAADAARVAESAELMALGGDLLHPSLGLLVLLLVQVLNVFKPRGLTPYGWRQARGVPAKLRSGTTADSAQQ